MARLYHFLVGMLLVAIVTGYTPFILNATEDQQMAAADNDRLTNITQLFANRTDPVLSDEEGLASYLTSPIIVLTTSQEQELAQNFGPLLAPMAMDDFADLLCPTSYNGQLLLYVTLEQDGCLLQVITKIPFGTCRSRNPPGSCLDPQSAASVRCFCCVRYRTVVILAVKVSSCSTGSCQIILAKVTVPYCTCCQHPILIATSPDTTKLTTTELTTTPTTKLTTTELTTTPTTKLTTTKLTTTPTEMTSTPTHSTSTTPSYRTTQRSTIWPRQTTRRFTTRGTSSVRSSTKRTTTQTSSILTETTNSD